MTDTELLRDLFHRRWAMPTLAMLSRWKGAKFVTLHKQLCASAGSMRTTVDELLHAGLVMKNPGYGHPMRPEYILTELGALVGESCDLLLAEVDDCGARKIALSKWTMPVIFALKMDKSKFGEIRSRCRGITDRALTQTLKSCQSAGLVDRKVTGSYPPAVDYSLTEDGFRLVPHLVSLVSQLRDMAQNQQVS